MTITLRSTRIANPLLGLALIVALAACGDDGKPAAGDEQLAKDLELASSTPLPGQPVFQDTALSDGADPAQDPSPVPAPAPRREQSPAPSRRVSTGGTSPRPAPAPVRRPAPVTPAPVAQRDPQPQPSRDVADVPAPGPARSQPSVGAGTRIALVSDAKVCTSGRPGDKTTATVTETVRGSDGAEIPRGSTVVLEIASVTPGDPPENGRITFRIRAISVNGTTHTANGNGSSEGSLERATTGRSTASDRNKVIGGAIAGAVLGRVLGGDTRSTVAGAAAGAATGAVVASRSGGVDACMPSGAPLTVTLGSPVQMGN